MNLQSLEVEVLQYSQEIIFLDLPKDISEIRTEEIYMETVKTLKSALNGPFGKNILNILIDNLKKYADPKNFKIIFDENPIFRNKNNFSFNFLLISDKKENILNLKLNTVMKMKEIFSDIKFACVSFDQDVFSKVKNEVEKIFSCYFFVPSIKNSIFLIADMETAISLLAEFS